MHNDVTGCIFSCQIKLNTSKSKAVTSYTVILTDLSKGKKRCEKISFPINTLRRAIYYTWCISYVVRIPSATLQVLSLPRAYYFILIYEYIKAGRASETRNMNCDLFQNKKALF